MRCKYCHVRIYFTGVLYRSVATKSYTCYASPNAMHKH